MKRRHSRAFVIGLLLFTILFTSAYGLLSANLNITGQLLVPEILKLNLLTITSVMRLKLL